LTPEQQIRADKAMTLAKLRFPGSDSLQLHVVVVELMSLPEAELDSQISEYLSGIHTATERQKGRDHSASPLADGLDPREAKIKRNLEVGCIVTHNGIGECVNDWSTVTPTKGHQGLVSQITKEYVWVAFTSYEGRCQAADLTVEMSPMEAKAAQSIIGTGTTLLPPGLPKELDPSTLLPSNDLRVTLTNFAINTIYECFPTTNLSWDGWQLSLNAGFLQLTVDLGPLPPPHNYLPPLSSKRTDKTRHGIIKLSMTGEATTAMLVLKVNDDAQAEVETKERMALHNSIPTDLQGWIFHCWTVWTELLDTKFWKALGLVQVISIVGTVPISRGEIVEITSDSRYFRLPPKLDWNTVSKGTNPLVSPEFVEVTQ